jgi:RHS repeat-associated protein
VGGLTTGFTYDSEAVIREVRGSSSLKYVQGFGVDEPLAREDGSANLTYYHADALGSVVKLTNQVGALVHEYRYDAWGNIETGASEPGYSFTGRDWDPETGLYDYRARKYDPRLGLFLSEDPVQFRDGLSLYTYVLSNPVNLIDPRGWTAERPSCGRSCNRDVKDGARDACIGGASHPDAWVRRCMKEKCKKDTIECLPDDDDYCQQKTPSGNRNPAGTLIADPSRIIVCQKNLPPHSCWKRVLIHEMAYHSCFPNANHNKMDHMTMSWYFVRTVRCP